MMPNWIPITQPPTKPGIYIVFVQQGKYEPAHVTTARWSGIRQWLRGHWEGDVTHWMPLPDPPTEEPTDEATN